MMSVSGTITTVHCDPERVARSLAPDTLGRMTWEGLTLLGLPETPQSALVPSEGV